MKKNFSKSFIGYNTKQVYGRMKEISNHYEEVAKIYENIEKDLKNDYEVLKKEIEYANLKKELQKNFKENLYKTLNNYNLEVAATTNKESL